LIADFKTAVKYNLFYSLLKLRDKIHGTGFPIQSRQIPDHDHLRRTAVIQISKDDKTDDTNQNFSELLL
jgi:hypothetical protein